MRRPAGVVVAAVILGLMALMGIFGSLISVVVTVFAGNPAVPPVPGMRAVMIATTVMMLSFSLFCAWTVVGLFQMRAWARYSILAIGGLEFLFSALMCVVMILVRNAPPVTAAAPPPVSYRAVFLVMAAFYGGLSLIGAWWLVYFNLAPVRAAFSRSLPPAATDLEPGLAGPAVGPGVGSGAETSGWRIVIVVWACLMLLGILYLPFIFAMHLPLFFFGVVVRGNAASTLMLALLAVQFYLGVGLLRKWKPAWYVALAWQVYSVAFLLTFLMPGMWARFSAYQQDLMGRWGVTAASPNGNYFVDPRPFAEMGMVLGLAIVVVLTVALMRRREDYLHAS